MSAALDVPEGYKLTEVGVIPGEWEVAPIGSLITDFRGGAPLKPSDFTTMGVKVLPKGGVGRIGWLKIENSDPQYCSPDYAITHRRNQVNETFTIVVLRDLVPAGPSIGLMVQIREKETFVLAQGVYGFQVNSSALPGYLVQLSNTRWYRTMANSIMVGSTQVHITNTAFKRSQIPLPPIAEQRAIATALLDVDALLAKLDQLIAKKRNLKQAAMQQLLTGQTRLPGFSGEWEVKRLGDVATIRDGTHQTPKYVASGIPFFSVEHVTSGDFKNTKFITEEEHRFLTRSFKIEKGDILMTRIGSIGDCKLIDWEVDASFYVSLALLKIKPGYSATYIAHYSKSASFQTEVEFHSLQSAIPRKINLGPISNVKIELPPTIPEQTAIATLLSDMDAELAALDARRDKTRALKQGMMQALLTGRIRLP
jgi:type I restriction enzyme, S subunit